MPAFQLEAAFAWLPAKRSKAAAENFPKISHALSHDRLFPAAVLKKRRYSPKN